MFKKLMIICLMLSTFNTVTPFADAAGPKKTHISSMAQLKKSSIFTKRVQMNEPLAGPVSQKGHEIYVSIASIAPDFVGTPYVFGGGTTAGFDCSGFIYYLHNTVGLKINRKSSEDYYHDAGKVFLPEVGDLVFFKDTYKTGISHMGVFIGENQFVHAGSKGVEITKLDNPYWKKHFVGFKRFHSVTSN